MLFVYMKTHLFVVTGIFRTLRFLGFEHGFPQVELFGKTLLVKDGNPLVVKFSNLIRREKGVGQAPTLSSLCNHN